MNRRFLIVAVFALASHWTAAFAQITIPESTPLGAKIVAKVDLPAGGRVAWKVDAGAEVVSAGLGRAYVWATPGAHSIQAVIAPSGDGDLTWHAATYSVGDSPAPPAVKTLADLAGDKASILAELLGDIRDYGLPIATHVDALKRGFASGLATIRLAADHPAAVEIVKRIDATASGAITDDGRKALGETIATAIAELGAPPVPPVVVEGKRLIVILHETADTTPAEAAIFTALRVGEQARYLADKGHSLLILDDDAEGPSGESVALVARLKAEGVPLPAQFVLDPATKSVLGKQPLSSSAAGVVEFAKGYGG